MNGCHPFTKKSQVKLVICWGMPTFWRNSHPQLPQPLGFPGLDPLGPIHRSRHAPVNEWRRFLQTIINIHQLQYHSGGEKKNANKLPGGGQHNIQTSFYYDSCSLWPQSQSPMGDSFTHMAHLFKPHPNKALHVKNYQRTIEEWTVPTAASSGKSVGNRGSRQKTPALAVVCLPPGPKVGLPWLQHQNAGLKSKQFQCNWLRASGSGLMGGKNPKKRTTGGNFIIHVTHVYLYLYLLYIYIRIYLHPVGCIYIYRWYIYLQNQIKKYIHTDWLSDYNAEFGMHVHKTHIN